MENVVGIVNMNAFILTGFLKLSNSGLNSSFFISNQHSWLAIHSSKETLENSDIDVLCLMETDDQGQGNHSFSVTDSQEAAQLPTRVVVFVFDHIEGQVKADDVPHSSELLLHALVDYNQQLRWLIASHFFIRHVHLIPLLLQLGHQLLRALTTLPMLTQNVVVLLSRD